MAKLPADGGGGGGEGFTLLITSRCPELAKFAISVSGKTSLLATKTVFVGIIPCSEGASEKPVSMR